MSTNRTIFEHMQACCEHPEYEQASYYAFGRGPASRWITQVTMPQTSKSITLYPLRDHPFLRNPMLFRWSRLHGSRGELQHTLYHPLHSLEEGIILLALQVFAALQALQIVHDIGRDHLTMQG